MLLNVPILGSFVKVSSGDAEYMCCVSELSVAVI